VAEILTEVEGKLIVGPPKTPAGRRTGGRRAGGPTSVSFTLDRYGHQTIPGRSRGPVLSSRGLDCKVRQHGRRPQDARSPG
jgi:hypothetical protein